MQKRKRQGTIATLMVLSFLMLAGFTARWLFTQYREEKQLMQTSLARAFDTRMQYYFDKAFAKEFIAENSIINSEAQTDSSIHYIVMKDSEGTHISEKEFSNWSDSLRDAQSTYVQKMDKREPHKMQKVIVRKASDTNKKKMTFSSSIHSNLEIKIDGAGDTIRFGNSTSGAKPVTDTAQIRAAITSMINELGQKMFPLPIDMNSFKKDFDSIVKTEYNGVHYSFKKPLEHEIPVAIEKSTNALSLSVGGFQLYLIKKMTAQILFCFILLLLCGLAFLLSFLTIRQQMKLGEQKNDFISNMSHELKTPVSTAQLALEAFNHFDIIANPQKTNEYLQIARWEMKRLEMLVATVLNNARLEEGRISFQKTTFSLNELLQQLTQQFKPLCDETGREIHFGNSLASVTFFGDIIHMQGALYNIIDNAVKYGKEKITIVLHATENQIHLSVSDDGAGIPTSLRNKVFDKFFRIPTGNEHSIKGYGLGLHYAKYVVEQHGGTITIGDSLSGGASLFINFPRDKNNEC